MIVSHLADAAIASTDTIRLSDTEHDLGPLKQAENMMNEQKALDML